MSDETRTAAADRNGDARPAAISLATTEILALQGARSATIYESTGRATIFLGAVSGGLIALGLVATATRVSTAFYAFGLVLLPTLAFVGWVTFERALRTSIEDHDYARRMSRLRAFNFDAAPELAAYMPRTSLQDRIHTGGFAGARWAAYRTIAGMIAVVTSVLVGATAALVTALFSSHSLAASIIAGVLVAIVAVAALMEYQLSVWLRYAVESEDASDMATE
jgi:hypothetical protein